MCILILEHEEHTATEDDSSQQRPGLDNDGWRPGYVYTIRPKQNEYLLAFKFVLSTKELCTVSPIKGF